MVLRSGIIVAEKLEMQKVEKLEKLLLETGKADVENRQYIVYGSGDLYV